MPIHGTDPTDGDNASLEYEVILKLVRNRVRENIDRLPTLKKSDVTALAAVQALRILATALPHLGVRIGLEEEVPEWREKYLAWFDKAKIPKKYRDRLRESAVEEFA